ncbi:hypothetical protein Tco_0137488, partial [Tanacetum coccineum]
SRGGGVEAVGDINGGVTMVVVVAWWPAVAAGWGGGGVVEARGGEWVWGSNRSGEEECFWSWPKKSAGKVFRRRRSGGGRNPAVGRWPDFWGRWRRERESYKVCVYNLRWK